LETAKALGPTISAPGTTADELIDEDIDLSLIATRAQMAAFDPKQDRRHVQKPGFDTKTPLTIRS